MNIGNGHWCNDVHLYKPANLSRLCLTYGSPPQKRSNVLYATRERSWRWAVRRAVTEGATKDDVSVRARVHKKICQT